MNLQDHLPVYFEFDLGKNNFTFVFNIYPFHHDSEMFPDVQYTEVLHLLCSKSLLIVLDEFEKITHIVSQIVFIIIQLLYFSPDAVTCVAVSNLLKSVNFMKVML